MGCLSGPGGQEGVQALVGLVVDGRAVWSVLVGTGGGEVVEGGQGPAIHLGGGLLQGGGGLTPLTRGISEVGAVAGQGGGGGDEEIGVWA